MPLQMGAANSTGLSLPQLPVGGLQYLPRKGGILEFLILPSLLLQRLSSGEWGVQLRDGRSSLPPPTRGMEAPPCVWCAEKCWAPVTITLALS